MNTHVFSLLFTVLALFLIPVICSHYNTKTGSTKCFQCRVDAFLRTPCPSCLPGAYILDIQHHKRALGNGTIPGVSFYIDQKANRVGVLTTEAIKHAMCQLVVVMLRERRIHVFKPLASRDAKGLLLRLREQMEVYSYQFKMGTNTFQKDRIALSGKVGGMKDDICICLQLACYFTQLESQRAVQTLNTPID